MMDYVLKPIEYYVEKAADQLRRLGNAIVPHDVADEVATRLNQSGLFPDDWIYCQRGLYETWLLKNQKWK